MFCSLHPSDAWNLPPKQRLSTFLTQAPAHCRVAPSPTGHFHLGTARTALHNSLAAQASGGTFSLRIDDTDAARNDDAHVALIHRSLDALGITPDRCFHQSARRDAHTAAAQRLLDDGWAVRDNGAVRLAPQARHLAPDRFFDLAAGICPISATFLDHADHLVLLRSDGSPTYHFASVVDDIDAGITLILRGADHLANVGKQAIIAHALAQAGHPAADVFYTHITFAHVGLIMKAGKKLSKRDGDSHLFHYLDAGIQPQAINQWALTLGWGHPDPQFDRAWPRIDATDMPTVFAQGGLRAANCTLDGAKLTALDRRWKHRPHSQQSHPPKADL